MTTATDRIAKYVINRDEPSSAALIFGPTVWFVIAGLQTYRQDIRTVAHELGVPIEAVKAAKAYYSQHSQPIDARIELNRS